MWYIYTMEYYTAKRKDDILLFATAWMDFGNIMQKQYKSNKKLRNICFDSYVKYKTEINK